MFISLMIDRCLEACELFVSSQLLQIPFQLLLEMFLYVVCPAPFGWHCPGALSIGSLCLVCAGYAILIEFIHIFCSYSTTS